MSRNANQQRMNLLKKLWKEEMQINAYSLYSRDLEESIKRLEKERVLLAEGYRMVDDAWWSKGRCTYVHDEDATRSYLSHLGKVLQKHDWTKDATVLRTFRHVEGGEMIEIEPGGSGVEGHLLHHMQELK